MIRELSADKTRPQPPGLAQTERVQRDVPEGAEEPKTGCLTTSIALIMSQLTAAQTPTVSVATDAAASATPARGEIPLTPGQLAAVAAARHRGRKIRRATAVAAVSGWTTAVFASLTLLCGLFSVAALALGIGLAAVAFVELRGARQLRRFRLSAPRALAFNQMVLCGILLAYAAWGVAHALLAPSPYETYLAGGGQVADVLEPIDRLQRAAVIAFYTLLIGFSLLAQGCMSAYYFSRRRHLLAYMNRTPKWVLDMLRVAGG